MFCGYIGCGRKYHDGTGGNNHQIDHFKQANHGVCVKLGTITPDGNACKLRGHDVTKKLNWNVNLMESNWDEWKFMAQQHQNRILDLVNKHLKREYIRIA